MQKIKQKWSRRVRSGIMLQLIGMIAILLILALYAETQTVTILADDNEYKVAAVSQDAQTVLDHCGLELNQGDVYQAQHDENGNLVSITVTRGYPVTIFADGTCKTVYTANQTTSEILELAGITLGENDEVSPRADEIVQNGSDIVVFRITTETYTEESTIQHGVDYQYTSVLSAGKQLQRSSGSNGIMSTTYQKTYVNGVYNKIEALSQSIVTQPVNSVVAVGKKGAAVSPLDYSSISPLDSNGIPTRYTKKISGARATGYSASSNKTASGIRVPGGVGTVAVDPTVIPYGTKLYIRSSDGSFVYGYAIAAETGSAFHGGTTAVDLFYATYEESCANGAKSVDIYILG